MPSIKLRTCARTHISIGSNQSSKSWVLVQAAECSATDFVLLLPMAWSPPAWQRRNRLGWTTRRLRHFQFPPIPLRHHSTNGASTHTTLLALIKHFNVAARPVSTGAAALTMTQAMSRQIDVGWASPPFGLEALSEAKIRLIARGSDAPSTRDQTVRVHI